MLTPLHTQPGVSSCTYRKDQSRGVPDTLGHYHVTMTGTTAELQKHRILGRSGAS